MHDQNLTNLYIMRNVIAPKDEDQRQQWHLQQLSEVIERATQLKQLLAFHLSSLDRAELAEPISSLVLDAYAAGRLNPMDPSEEATDA